MTDRQRKWPGPAQIARAIVPRHAVIGWRLLDVFLRQRGQARRNRLGMCVDAWGNPVPWITYPAIDFLESLDLSQARVFEFGMGSSTAYWSRRGCSIAGVEMDPSWHARIESLNLPNVTARLCTDGGLYPRVIDEYRESFDLILVDGAERYRSARRAMPRLTSGGMLILDNCEWYPHAAQMLREQHFTQVDFCGFPPRNAFPSVTSVFFRERLRFAYLSKPAGWCPIGGRDFSGGALDDRGSDGED